jgi:hypothetical protein
LIKYSNIGKNYNMISSFLNRATSGAVLRTTEYDSIGMASSIGLNAMQRVKRDGRNPSTGSRGSRKYGNSIIWLSGFAPYTDGSGILIY